MIENASNTTAFQILNKSVHHVKAFTLFKYQMPSNPHHINPTDGDTPKPIPKQAREISAFFSLLVDETMKTMPDELTPTWIRCFRKGCTGTISSSVDLDENKLFWECSECVNNGTLTGF